MYITTCRIACIQSKHKYTHLSNVNTMNVSSSCGSIVSKDCSSVAVLISIDDVDSIIQSVNFQATQDRPKDFLKEMHINLRVITANTHAI